MPVGKPLSSLSNEELRQVHARASQRHQSYVKAGRRLDMTRGKPSAEQLALSQPMLALPGENDWRSEDGLDCRNYGGPLTGLAEARRLLAPLAQVAPDQVLVGGNASLAVMHDCLAFALLHGVPGGDAPWSRQEDVAFLCPSPGYDRHFGLCEGLGVRMIPVALTGQGPDMDQVERLVASDPAIKGMWCVPKYSNPTGETYSAETVERLAAMPTAAADFRLFWDNAYGVHDLTETSAALPSILERAAAHGRADRPFVFASTSKMTFAGAGLALFAGSAVNLRWLTLCLARRTIGPDKLNQLRHVRWLRDFDGLLALMARHRQLLAPKFALVREILARDLDGLGIATWTDPKGGYFISLDVMDGCAQRTVAIAAEAGLTLVPAGQTFPYGQDPNDRNIRLAPSFPGLEDLRVITECVANSTILAATDALLRQRGL
jgi:DNA-binding transcriptional MocR family regulator